MFSYREKITHVSDRSLLFDCINFNTTKIFFFRISLFLKPRIILNFLLLRVWLKISFRKLSNICQLSLVILSLVLSIKQPKSWH